MPKKTYRKQNSSPSDMLKKPAVQFGILGVVALIVILIIAFSNSSSSGLPAEITAEEAYTMYGQADTYFVDVREPSEWVEYHAPNTTLIPLGELASRVNELPKDKKIVVVCRSGNRSQSGRDILLQAGFENVTSMAGGLKTWQSLGYPIETGQ
jgi:rhodanese-related sulfurtransferase